MLLSHVVISVLSEEITEHSTFETIASNFQSSVFLPSQCEPYHIGMALTTLLQHHDLIPKHSQKLSCLFLLYELYRHDHVANNPFVAIFIQILVRKIYKRQDD